MFRSAQAAGASGITHERCANFRHRKKNPKKNRNGGILRLRLAYGRRSNKCQNLNRVWQNVFRSNSLSNPNCIYYNYIFILFLLQLHFIYMFIIPLNCMLNFISLLFNNQIILNFVSSISFHQSFLASFSDFTLMGHLILIAQIIKCRFFIPRALSGPTTGGYL